MKELVSSIENGLKKITKGDITLPELEQIVDSSRELYERLLIVRYKVYENSILKEEISLPDLPTQDLEKEIITKEIEIEEKIAEESNTIENKEIEIIFEDIEDAKPEDSIIRFDLFDAPEIEIKKEEGSSKLIDEEKLEENKNIEEEIVLEESHFEKKENPKENEISKEASELIPKLEKLEKTIAQNYQVMPIETLIGSFTLNERLQFINELFDGSSDLFSSSIKRLDTQENMTAARNVIAEFAQENAWDLDGEVVEDFMLKICSRYENSRAN
jgi:hypothetical protein